MKRFNSNKIEKIIRFLITSIILGISISSCNLGNTLKYPDDNGKARLLFSKNSLGRLIGPTDIDEDDVVKAELYACPVNTTRVKKLKVWSSIALMESESDLLINPGTYDFTLKLYVTVEGETVLSQTGTINLTVNPGDNLLSFNTHYVSEGIGNLSVGVSWTETTRIEKVRAKLYEINENLSTDYSNILYEQLIYNDSEAETKGVAQFNVNSIDSGYYSLVLEIFDNSEALRNTFEYTAKIVSGCTSHASLY